MKELQCRSCVWVMLLFIFIRTSRAFISSVIFCCALVKMGQKIECKNRTRRGTSSIINYNLGFFVKIHHDYTISVFVSVPSVIDFTFNAFIIQDTFWDCRHPRGLQSLLRRHWSLGDYRVCNDAFMVLVWSKWFEAWVRLEIFNGSGSVFEGMHRFLDVFRFQFS